MKKIIAFCTWIVFTVTCVGEIPNAGFESGTNNWTGDINLSITEETIIFHSGSKSLNCTFDSQTQANCDLRSDYITGISENTSYTVVAWFYDNDPSGRANIVIEWYDNANTLLGTDYYASYTSDQPNWQQLAYTRTSPTGSTKAKVGCRFYDVDGWDGNCTIYVDDFTGTDPFPVELSSFSAYLKGNEVNLKWQTKTEVENYGFEIERAAFSVSHSTDWLKIGFVSGSGNSNSPKDYTFVDKTVSSGKYIYRLKQIDVDGKFEYSKAVEVDLDKPELFYLGQNYPNPFNPTTKINYSLPTDAEVKLAVYNLEGELIKSLVNEKQAAGSYSIDFNADALATGMYIYKLIANDFIQIKKMLLTK